jgi:hypothetical protein
MSKEVTMALRRRNDVPPLAPALTANEFGSLLPAETAAFASPIPTQFVSSDEFLPLPQTRRQREVEARVKELGARLAKHQGVSRRRFFQSAAGMAAAFVAMNDVYGRLFDASPAEAATPDAADERARALADQFIMDMHTHFLRDDTRLEGFVRSREAVGKAGWNPALAGKPQTLEDLKFANYFKEIYFDSDTKVALISGSGSEEPRDWFLTNEMKAEARAKVNRLAGARRMFSHAIFMPGMRDGWRQSIARSPSSSPIRSRATPWATTRTSSSPGIRGGWTTRSSSIPSTKSSSRPASSTSACTRASIRNRRPGSFRIWSPTPTSATWGRPRGTGRSSTS